jgi:hypothetical protein
VADITALAQMLQVYAFVLGVCGASLEETRLADGPEAQRAENLKMPPLRRERFRPGPLGDTTWKNAR